MDFRLVSAYTPRGDQATAIEQLVGGLKEGEKHQVLLGVTGSGKTFTMAKVVEKLKKEMARLKKELKDNDEFAHRQPPPGVDGQPPGQTRRQRRAAGGAAER